MAEIIRVTDPATIRAQVITEINDPNNILIEKRTSPITFDLKSIGTGDILEKIPKDTVEIIVIYMKKV